MEREYGLPEGSIFNHIAFEFARGRRDLDEVHFTTDESVADQYSIPEVVQDALTSAHMLLHPLPEDVPVTKERLDQRKAWIAAEAKRLMEPALLAVTVPFDVVGQHGFGKQFTLDEFKALLTKFPDANEDIFNNVRLPIAALTGAKIRRRKWDPNQARDKRGKFTEQASVTVGDRQVTVVKPERATRAGDKLVPVNVTAFDEEFQRDQDLYIGVGGQGGIGTRYERFGQFIGAHDSIEAAEVTVQENGRVGFTNGRHRYAWLRDQGLTSIPVAMTKESVTHAKRYGLLAAVKLAWDESKHPRDKGGKFVLSTAVRQTLDDFGFPGSAWSVNRALREDRTDVPTERMVTTLDALMRPEPAEDLHRVVDAGLVGGLKVGDTYEEKGYTSTSRRPDDLSQFDEGGRFHTEGARQRIVVRVPKNYPRLDTDRYAPGPSVMGPAEGEVILPRGTKFQVVATKPTLIVTVIPTQKWDESQHPRNPKGSAAGGEFKSKGGIAFQENPSPEAFIAARNKSKRVGYLSPLEPADLKGYKLYLSKDGTIGGALSPDGDMGNLFNNGGPKNAAHDILLQMMADGGKTADAFDGYLPKLYANFGLQETGRMKFNPEYAPPGWNFAEDDSPDVIFLALTGAVGTADEIRQRARGDKAQWFTPQRTTNYYDDYDLAKRDALTRAESSGTRPFTPLRPDGGRGVDGETRPLGSEGSESVRRRVELPKAAWDESQHPRDTEGQFTESVYDVGEIKVHGAGTRVKLPGRYDTTELGDDTLAVTSKDGYLLLSKGHLPNTMWGSHVWVGDKTQGKGVATALYATAVRELQTRGFIGIMKGGTKGVASSDRVPYQVSDQAQALWDRFKAEGFTTPMTDEEGYVHDVLTTPPVFRKEGYKGYPTLKQEHKFGNTQIHIDPTSSAAATLNTARAAIKDADVMGDGKDVDPNHVTVRYGLLNEDLNELRAFLAAQAPFEARVIGIELFPASEHSDGAVPVVARIASPELRALEQEIGKHAEFKEKSFPKYKPHCTLAYCKPEAAEKYADLYVDGSFMVFGITISHKSGKQEFVPLGGGVKKWDESKHPRDKEGQFTEAAIQRGEAHTVSEDEFLKYHYTGHIESSA